jgi:peptidoglycan/LPS O-acetylase OafA/YrhL
MSSGEVAASPGEVASFQASALDIERHRFPVLPREKRLRELDGWRAVSVLLVILYHVAGYQHHGLVSRSSFLDLRLHYAGPLAVKIFFVVSGFVICRLLISEGLRYGSVSLKAFYYRRALRILPPLYVYLAAISLLLCLGLIQERARSILGAALFLYDVGINPQSWFVGHTWSLAVEEQFYLIFPTMWVLTPKARRGQVFLAVFSLCAAWNVLIGYTGWHSHMSSETRAGFACIGCGVLMAIHEARIRPIVIRVPALIVALVGFTLLLHPVGSTSWQAVLYESVLVPPAIGLVLLFSLDRGVRLRAFLCSRPVQAVGLTSYGIYLWQQLFTGPQAFLSDTGQFIPAFLGAGRIIPQLLPLLCLIVPLSYFLIEKPAMAYGKFLSRRTRKDSFPVGAGSELRGGLLVPLAVKSDH